jgi:hypothetical protein
VTIGFTAGEPPMPPPEAEEFVRRVAESVGSLVARLRIAEREHQIAARLQEALLPAGMGQPEGVTIAARYAAGSAVLQVGGDFYDTFNPRGRAPRRGGRRRRRPRTGGGRGMGGCARR